MSYENNPQRPKLEQILRPVMEQDLEIRYVPIFYLEECVGKEFVLPARESAKEESIRTIKDWVYFLRGEKNSLDVERLREAYISSYCAFNFVSHTLGIEKELEETRSSFLEMAMHEPYCVSSEGKPIALELYHRASSDYGEGLVCQNLRKDFFIEGFEKISSEQICEMPVITNAIERKIVLSAREAYAEIKKRENKNPLDAQLRFLIAGILLPKMFGISLTSYGIKDARETYTLSAEKHGDFEMPIPEIFSEAE